MKKTTFEGREKRSIKGQDGDGPKLCGLLVFLHSRGARQEVSGI